MRGFNMAKRVSLQDVSFYIREMYGVLNPLTQMDAENRKCLLKARRMSDDKDDSFPAFVISHYWNRCIAELSQKEEVSE